MANVDVRCPFCEQTASVKNTVMAKVPISGLWQKCPSALPLSVM
ncbi:MAG: hypothetical protein ACR5LF_12615 [Symbiopectobacterium sp.]